MASSGIEDKTVSTTFRAKGSFIEEVKDFAESKDLTVSFLVRYGLRLAIAQIEETGAIEL